MGKLIRGKWVKSGVLESGKNGEVIRPPRTFLDKIDKNHSIYKPEKNRYHLYVSLACPWAHRAMIMRKLKKLDKFISVSVVHPDMLDMGWSFDKNFPNSTGDNLYNFKFLHQLYQFSEKNLNTSVTVPVLWDKKTRKIVNNESSQIIRIFNYAFNDLTKNYLNYYPENLKKKIDQINNRIYEDLNNGVYKAGFAKTQKAYDSAINKMFKTLSYLNNYLSDKKFLVGDRLTEADIRLIPTLIRFDSVYYVHFKCNIKKISEFKFLYKYLETHYKIPAVNKTTNIKHIKRHYYYSHESINPYRIIPQGIGSLLK